MLAVLHVLRRARFVDYLKNNEFFIIILEVFAIMNCILLNVQHGYRGHVKRSDEILTVLDILVPGQDGLHMDIVVAYDNLSETYQQSFHKKLGLENVRQIRFTNQQSYYGDEYLEDLKPVGQIIFLKTKNVYKFVMENFDNSASKSCIKYTKRGKVLSSYVHFYLHQQDCNLHCPI